MILHGLVTLITIFVIAWTLLPLLRDDAWWVRVFDFPRVQIAVIHPRYPFLRWPLDPLFCSPDFNVVSMSRRKPRQDPFAAGVRNAASEG